MFADFSESELIALKEYLDRLISNIYDEHEKADNMSFCHLIDLENGFKNSNKENETC